MLFLSASPQGMDTSFSASCFLCFLPRLRPWYISVSDSVSADGWPTICNAGPPWDNSWPVCLFSAHVQLHHGTLALGFHRFSMNMKSQSTLPTAKWMAELFFTPRPVGLEGVLSSPSCGGGDGRRFRRPHSFGYYTNMVQQIKFIIHTSIQPLPALCFTQGQGHWSKSKIKKKSC